MMIRSISLKNVAGGTRPVSVQLDSEVNALRIDADAAAALPWCVLSLLYPDAVPIDALTRLGGTGASTAWRMVVDIDGRELRISRSIAAATVTAELPGDVPGTWKTVAEGAEEVSRRIAQLAQLPPIEVTRALCMGTNPTRDVRGASKPNDDSRVALVDNESLLDQFAAGVEDGDIELTPEQRAELGLLFQQARTREFADDQTRALRDEQQSTIRRMSALVDDSGDLARLTEALAELPPVRPLTDEERAALVNPEHRVAELDRRIVETEDETMRVRRAQAAKPVASLGALVGGVAAGLLITAYAVFGPAGAYRLAIGNVLVFGVALWGGLRRISELEKGGRSARLLSTLEHRRDSLTAERARLEDLRRELRRELSVATIEQYDELAGRRERLTERLNVIRGQHAGAAQSADYLRLNRRVDGLSAHINMIRGLLVDLEAAEGQFSSTFETRLRAGGWDPTVVLWTPLHPDDSLRAEVRDLQRVLRGLGALNDGVFEPAVMENWRKLVRRIFGEDGSAGLGVVGDGGLTLDGHTDVIGVVPSDRCWLLVETLRLATVMRAVNHNGFRLPRIVLRIHPGRVHDSGLRDALDNIYTSLGRKLQVVRVAADS